MRLILMLAALLGTATVTLAAGGSLISSIEYPPATSPVARPAPRPQVKAVQAVAPPVIDGRLDDPCWQKGEWQSGFVLNDGSGRKAEAQTLFKVAYDGANIYIAAKCLEPKMSQLKSFWGARHDEQVFNDDCIELWLDVNNLHQRSYHIVLSNAGGLLDAVDRQRVQDDPKAATVGVKMLVTDSDMSWDTKTERACQKGDDHWTLAARVPVADLGVEEVLTGSTWGFNLARERWADGPEFSSLTGVFQFPLDQYAELQFGEPSVLVSMEGVGELGVGDNRVSLSLRNCTREQAGYTVRVVTRSTETHQETRQVDLAPGASRVEKLTCRFAGVSEYRLVVEVQEARGKKVFQQENVMPQQNPFELSLSSRNYYLGESVTANVSTHVGDATRERVRLRAAVLDEGGKEIVSGGVDKLQASSFRLGLDLARLKRPGYYRFLLALVEAEGKEVAREERAIRITKGPFFGEVKS